MTKRISIKEYVKGTNLIPLQNIQEILRHQVNKEANAFWSMRQDEIEEYPKPLKMKTTKVGLYGLFSKILP